MVVELVEHDKRFVENAISLNFQHFDKFWIAKATYEQFMALL